MLVVLFSLSFSLPLFLSLFLFLFLSRSLSLSLTLSLSRTDHTRACVCVCVFFLQYVAHVSSMQGRDLDALVVGALDSALAALGPQPWGLGRRAVLTMNGVGLNYLTCFGAISNPKNELSICFCSLLNDSLFVLIVVPY